MRRSLSSVLCALGWFLAARDASAGPFDLEDDDAQKADKDPTGRTKPDAVTAAPLADPSQVRMPPIQTIRTHAYTLSECLLLAERNAPQIWAAKARLASAHGQLDEARWTPFSY